MVVFADETGDGVGDRIGDGRCIGDGERIGDGARDDTGVLTGVLAGLINGVLTGVLMGDGTGVGVGETAVVWFHHHVDAGATGSAIVVGTRDDKGTVIPIAAAASTCT